MDATVTVEYAAPSACPSESELWGAIASRAPVKRADRGDYVIVVRIARAPKGYAGALRVTRAERVLSERALEDASCKDVMTALAIAAVLAVESAPPPPPPPPSQPPPPESPSSVDVPKSSAPWSLDIGASSAVTTLLGPSGSIGLCPSLGLERWGVRARAGAHLATSFPFDVEGATVTVTTALGRLELDPLHVRFADFALRVGVLGELGAMIVSTSIAGAKGQDARPFADAAALVRLAWEPSAFRLEIGAGPVFAVTKPTLRLQREGGPSVVAFDVPYAGVLAEMGLGVRLF